MLSKVAAKRKAIANKIEVVVCKKLLLQAPIDNLVIDADSYASKAKKKISLISTYHDFEGIENLKNCFLKRRLYYLVLETC